MTVLGKILVFVVLVLSLLWTYLTASTFAARTNWQAQAKQYQKAAQEAGKAAADFKAQIDAEREAGAELARTLREDRDRYAATTTLINEAQVKLVADYKEQQAAGQRQAAEAQPLIGQKNQLITEVALKDEQIRAKDAELDKLKLSEQAAVVRASERTNEAKAQTDRANRLADQVQSLQEALASVTARGGVAARPGQAAQQRVPAPPGFRASVVGTAVVGETLYVTINVGLDGGLQKNTELTLARLSGGGQYLGKLVVTQVNPKDAIGTFAWPSGRRPAAADYPKAGDTATGGN